MNLKFTFIVFGLLHFVSSLEEMYAPGNLVGQETEVMKLECVPGYHIDPQWALYGVGFSNCASPISLEVVRDRCYGMTSCNIMAVHTLFGDPCWGHGKTLTISYICVKNNEKFLKEKRDILHSGPYQRAKEGQYINLYCASGYVIHTMWANYGLQDQARCGAPSSLTVVKNFCDGKETCSVQASHSIFGDPCPGIDKHLDIIHKCVRNQTELDSLCSGIDVRYQRSVPIPMNKIP